MSRALVFGHSALAVMCLRGHSLRGWGWGEGSCCGLLLESAGFPSWGCSATVDIDGTVSVEETVVLPYRPEIYPGFFAHPGLIHAHVGRRLTMRALTVTLGELWAAQVGKGVAFHPYGTTLPWKSHWTLLETPGNLN